MPHPDPMGRYIFRVMKGIRRIDECEVAWSNPKWFTEVDPVTINLGSRKLCLLAQRAGSYEAGLERYGISDPEGLGFCEKREIPNLYKRIEYLTSATQHAISLLQRFEKLAKA